MRFLGKKSVFLYILLFVAIAFNYMITLIGADENLKLLILSFIPYLFFIFSRKKYILLLSTFMLFKFLFLAMGIFPFDYFYVDGEAYYYAYIIIKDAIIGGGEIPYNLEHVMNSPIRVSVGFYYYLLIYFSALVWIKINQYSQISIATSVLLLISPESYIFGEYIGKEIILLFIAMIAIYIAQNIYFKIGNQKTQYLLLIAVIVFGSFMRPYFIAVVIAYLFF